MVKHPFIYQSSKHVIGLFVFVFILPLLLFLRPFRHVKIGHIKDERIGHLIADTEVFIRGEKTSLGNNHLVILISGEPANRTLLELYRKHLLIIESKICSRFYFYAFPFLKKTPFYQNINFDDYRDIPLLSSSSPTLTFKPNDRTTGTRFLRDVGLSEHDWFICIHARDDNYLTSAKPQTDWSNNAVRNCSILNFKKAANSITNSGGYVFHMGEKTGQVLWKDSNLRIIDYARDHRSDFLDIFLAANCRFFLGCASGLFLTAWAFGRPVAHTNLVPLGAGPYSTSDLYIPKLYKSLHDGSLIHFEEIMKIGLIGPNPANAHYSAYKANGIEPIENSPDEISELCEEMLFQIDGHKSKLEDEELQIEFSKKYLSWIGTPNQLSKPSIRFLKRHQSLFF